MDLGLKDAVVLVTGGNRGVGRAIAIAFAREGAKVAICGRDAASLAQTRSDIVALGAECVALQADLGEANACADVVERTAAAFGALTVLVNNASMSADKIPARFTEMSDEQAMVRINGKLLLAMRCSRASISHMVRAGHGRIIHIGGSSARNVFRGSELPGNSSGLPQGLGNAAIASFSKYLAEELIGNNILVNVVHPHLVRTDRHAARVAARARELGVSDAEAEKAIGAQIPLGRGDRSRRGCAVGGVSGIALRLCDHWPVHCRGRRRVAHRPFLKPRMTLSPLPDGRRAALVTGCSRPDGIGWHTAIALAQAGMAVVVTDVVRDAQVATASMAGTDAPSTPPVAFAEGGLDRLVDHIVSTGGQCAWLQGDVSSEADASRLVAQTVERFGRLDVLVNNAAAPHGRDRSDIEDIPLEAWDRVMAINVRGVFLMSRAAVAHMRRARWGRIVNVSSAVFRYGARHRSAYAASKAAVAGFTRALAMDVAGSGITVNSVCPGSILTARARNTTGEMLGFADLERGLATRARAIPAGRHGRAEEVAATIAFLCSDAAGYMTGQDLFIDGGGMPLPEFQGHLLP